MNDIIDHSNNGYSHDQLDVMNVDNHQNKDVAMPDNGTPIGNAEFESFHDAKRAALRQRHNHVLEEATRKSRAEALLCCPVCGICGDRDRDSEATFDWEVVMKCSNPCCSHLSSWSVCSKCMNSKAQYTSWVQIRRHNYNFHRDENSQDEGTENVQDVILGDDQNANDEDIGQDTTLVPEDDNDEETTSDQDQDNQDVDISSKYFDREPTREYFTRTGRCRSAAAKFLVAKYALKEESLAEQLSNDKARWVIELARFADKISRSEAELLAVNVANGRFLPTRREVQV
jgi:hypothetical protein